MLLALFYIVHVVISLFLIGVVLLQQGKGADLAVFGGGGTMTAFGARGAATVLHKMTVTSFVLFIVTTMAIGLMLGSSDESTVMTGVEAAAAAVEEPAAGTDGGDGGEAAGAGAAIDPEGEDEVFEDDPDGVEELEEDLEDAAEEIDEIGEDVGEAQSDGP